uniref:Uncharacterized protein n=1 Tax=Trichuris muris TaxID=70415 RepID=A0A5S6Q6X1_TRIMR
MRKRTAHFPRDFSLTARAPNSAGRAACACRRQRDLHFFCDGHDESAKRPTVQLGDSSALRGRRSRFETCRPVNKGNSASKRSSTIDGDRLLRSGGCIGQKLGHPSIVGCAVKDDAASALEVPKRRRLPAKLLCSPQTGGYLLSQDYRLAGCTLFWPPLDCAWLRQARTNTTRAVGSRVRTVWLNGVQVHYANKTSCIALLACCLAGNLLEGTGGAASRLKECMTWWSFCAKPVFPKVGDIGP